MLMNRAFLVVKNVRNCRFIHLGQPLLDQKFKFGETESRPEKRLLIEDKVPQGYRLVYRAPMKNYVLMNQILCSSSVFMAGGVVAVKAANLVALDLPLSDLLESSNFTPVEVGGAFAMAAVLIGSLVSICQRFPLRMYKSEAEKKFLYVKYGFLPFATKRYQINFGGVKIKNAQNDLDGLHYGLDTVNKSGLILFPTFFRTPSDFLDLLSD
ncbi:uncharacterized protein LOC135946547 [Cloeon dipterum]|uniref:uncharacterized protein LOC135946547 n=1 Tax=Cloeon dipterum TaxID=197152 RepID=UPI003220582E